MVTSELSKILIKSILASLQIPFNIVSFALYGAFMS